MFIPHSSTERDQMLESIGVEKIEELFKDIPDTLRFPKIDLPDAMTEMEAIALARELSGANDTVTDLACFLGAGAYHHYIPSAVDHILRRGEFYTAYTPYQPEISQGTLQAIFEYQSLMARLTGMDTCNASHYDGATSVAEAGIMAFHHFRGLRKHMVISPSVHPHYRQTFRTYMKGFPEIRVTGDEDYKNPFLTPDDMMPEITEDTGLIIVQYPDFFGRLFNLTKLSSEAHAKGALLAVAVNPMALGLFTPPGAMGADIVVGEGQPLGIPISFGGPYLGIFATKKEFARKISGRLVGETEEASGEHRKGYVLTLTAREQHIRREKATSNICSNQGLMALAATTYLSLLGKSGLKKVAELNYHKAHYAANVLSKLKHYSLVSSQPFFNEFVLKCPRSITELNEHLLEHQILGGFDLGCINDQLMNHMLIAVTEMNNKEDIELFANVLEEIR